MSDSSESYEFVSSKLNDQNISITRNLSHPVREEFKEEAKYSWHRTDTHDHGELPKPQGDVFYGHQVDAILVCHSSWEL